MSIFDVTKTRIVFPLEDRTRTYCLFCDAKLIFTQRGYPCCQNMACLLRDPAHTNPLLRAWQATCEHEASLDGYWSSFHVRDLCINDLSWAVPNDEALDALAELGPLVEVGAGGGYWSALLRSRGVEHHPFDPNPYPLYNHWVRRTHAPVAKGGAERAFRMHPDVALMLCWPTGYAVEVLPHHRGDTLAYIGEGEGGCCAGEDFFQLLDAYGWQSEREVDIPRWYGMHDGLTIYRR